VSLFFVKLSSYKCYEKELLQTVMPQTKRRNEMQSENDEYYSIERRKEIKDEAKKLRRKFLRYKEAEIVYSIQHKKLLELADQAGALYRIDGYVLINRDIFDEYLERFRQEPIQKKQSQHGGEK
jgi:hypothetical protein